MKIKILHTNDVHSNLQNFSRAATLIEDIKDKNTLIFDSGDFTDFKNITVTGTRGKVADEVFAQVGYWARAIGNNEMFGGNEILFEMARESKIPLISTNLRFLDGSDIPNMKKSVLLDFNGIKILVLSLSPNLEKFLELDGLSVKDSVQALNEEILKNENEYDLCILLSHLGTPKDRIIAENVDEIDVIIGGHFHELYEEPLVINGTIINSAGNFGEHVGEIQIELENGEVNLINGRNISTHDYNKSQEVDRILKRNKAIAVENLSRPLYEVEHDLWHDVIEENSITNFLADALRDVLKCEIGLINSGVLNGGIKKGIVHEKKLLDICPSPLNPTYMEVKGVDIRRALQDSLDSEVCLNDGRGPGFRGRFVGRLHFSNMIVSLSGRKISKVLVGEEILRDDRWYTVATSDYLQRGSGYESLKRNRNERYNPEYLRDLIREYGCKKEFVEKSMIQRWREE